MKFSSQSQSPYSFEEISLSGLVIHKANGPYVSTYRNTKNKGISPSRAFFLFIQDVDIQQAHLNFLELGFSFSTIEKCEKLTAIHIIGTVIQAKATPVK